MLRAAAPSFGVEDAGFGLIPFHDAERRIFYLVARPFDREIVELYKRGGDLLLPALRSPNGGIVSYKIAMYLPVRYCPFCGAALQPVIDRDRDRFDEEAAAAEERER